MPSSLELLEEERERFRLDIFGRRKQVLSRDNVELSPLHLTLRPSCSKAPMRRAQRAAAACFAAAYTVQGYANDANSTHRAQPPAATNVRSTDLRDDAGGRGRGDSTRWPRLIVIPETRAVLSLFTIIRDRDTPHGEVRGASPSSCDSLSRKLLAPPSSPSSTLTRVPSCVVFPPFLRPFFTVCERCGPVDADISGGGAGEHAWDKK